ncbi:MAG: hypothetical protein DMG14_12765 [Acidobacteria bacterium]|nr:MAG: hypothetical protein DMG14_12765 [Acidobacteriota bacterium]
MPFIADKTRPFEAVELALGNDGRRPPHSLSLEVCKQPHSNLEVESAENKRSGFQLHRMGKAALDDLPQTPQWLPTLPNFWVVGYASMWNVRILAESRPAIYVSLARRNHR